MLVLPLVVFMLVFYAIPVVAMLMRSVTEPTLSLDNYAKLQGDPVFFLVFWNTMRSALLVTVSALVIGYPLALALARSGPRLSAIILMLVLLPFWTSILVRSYAWMVLLGRHGIVNEILAFLGLTDAPLKLLNTPLAVHLAMVHILLPYMILLIANTLRQIDTALPRAGASLGASPARVLLQVILPLSMPGVMAGSLLVFVLSLGFYITPALIGGPRDMTLSMLIVQQVDRLNWPYAACLSATLLAATLLVIVVAQRIPGVRRALRFDAQ